MPAIWIPAEVWASGQDAASRFARKDIGKRMESHPRQKLGAVQSELKPKRASRKHTKKVLDLSGAN